MNLKNILGKPALLLIDMQEFYRKILAPVIPNVTRMLSFCRDNNITVFFTQHGYEELMIKKGIMQRWDNEHVIVGESEYAIISEVSPQPMEPVIIKNKYDAFYKTDFEELLHQNHIQSVMICGAMTNLSCESTARSAFIRDFHVVFLSDAAACTKPEYHQATLLNIGYGFGEIKTVDEMISILKK